MNRFLISVVVILFIVSLPLPLATFAQDKQTTQVQSAESLNHSEFPQEFEVDELKKKLAAQKEDKEPDFYLLFLFAIFLVFGFYKVVTAPTSIKPPGG